MVVGEEVGKVVGVEAEEAGQVVVGEGVRQQQIHLMVVEMGNLANLPLPLAWGQMHQPETQVRLPISEYIA